MKNKNLSVANFFWGGELTYYEISNFLSFKDKNFTVKVWSYDNLELPDGIILKNANEIIPQEFLNKFTQNFQKSNMSSFSNLFRYKLLHKESGWWFDSDCICLKDVSHFENLAKNKKFVLALENPKLVGSSAMYINDESILESLLDETEKRIKRNNFNFYWGEIGPYLITDVFVNLKIFESVLDSYYFFKIKPEEFNILFNSKQRDYVISELKDSFICHTWNEMFRKFGIEKNKLPPKYSYLSTHIENYLPGQKVLHYGKYFQLRFNFLFKYIYKTISRIKTFI